MDHAGSVTLVSGAAVGIGATISRRLSSEGASVVQVHRDQAGEKSAGNIAKTCGSAIFVLGDLTGHARVRSAMSAAAQRFGGRDNLVNNAGGGGGPPYFPTPTRPAGAVRST